MIVGWRVTTLFKATMATILPKLEGNAADQSFAQAGNLAQQKAKWLYELERAQWQLRPSYEAPVATDRSSSATLSSADIAASPALTPSTSQSEKNSALDTPAQTQAQTQQSSALAQPIKSDLRYRPNETVTSTLLPLTNFPTPPIPPIGSNATKVGIPLPPAGRPEVTEAQIPWDKQHAHLVESEGEVSLWLRDTRLTAKDGVAILFSLRKHFTELGHKLTQLTLNGHQVNPDAVFQPNNKTK